MSDTIVGIRSTDRSKINTEINILPTGNAQPSEGKGHTHQDIPCTAKFQENCV